MCAHVYTGAFSLLWGAGVSLWGQGDVFSLLPVLNWTQSHRVDDPRTTLTPAASHPHQPLQVISQETRFPGIANLLSQASFCIPCKLQGSSAGLLNLFWNSSSNAYRHTSSTVDFAPVSRRFFGFLVHMKVMFTLWHFKLYNSITSKKIMYRP